MMLRERSSATSTAASGTPHGAADAPALPVGGAALEVANAGAGHLDLQHLGRVGHSQVAKPLGQGRPALGHREFGHEGGVQGAPLGVGEPNEGAGSSSVLQGRSAERHAFLISEKATPLLNRQWRQSLDNRTPLEVYRGVQSIRRAAA